MSGDNREIDKVKVMSCVSMSPFLRQSSFNTTGDEDFSLKRKFDDSGFERRCSKKECLSMSPWEFRRIRTELVDAQSQILRLEERIDQLHKKNKETVIFFDKETSEMKSNLEGSRRQAKVLEAQLEKVRVREKEAQELLREFQASFDGKRLNQDRRMAELQAEYAKILERLTEVETNSASKISALMEQNEAQCKKIAELTLQSKEEKERAENASARLSVVLEDFKDSEEIQLQLREATDRVQELESERAEWEEARAVATILQDRMLRLEDIEKELADSQKEVANLRLAVQSNVIMEEKIRDYELKLKLISERTSQYDEFETKIFELETELGKWVAVVENHCEGSTRDDLISHLADTNATILKSSLDRNGLEAELQKTVGDLELAQEALKGAQNAADEMKTFLEKTRTEVQLLRRKIALVTRERDSYRQQLDLFEKDLTVTGIGGKSGGNADEMDRVQELEGILRDYREQMKSLENQLAVCKTDDGELRIEAVRKLERELAEARAECERLGARRDQLEEMLEKRVQQGGYPSPSTRILHFRNNPCALAEQQQAADVAKLEKENECLRARVRLLESGEHLNLTTRAAADVEIGATARLKELEEQLKSAELKNTRLKEVFKRTSQDFRDVSYTLLGYRIDLVSNNIYKLSNMYSEDPNECFMFQFNRSGMMEMLETDYTNTFSDLVNEHLHRYNSIPCFLSAVTLTLHPTVGSLAESIEETQETDEPIEVELSD